MLAQARDKNGDTVWTASCDPCKALFLHLDFHTPVKSPWPDKLSETMRKRGWTTRKGKNIGDPLEWVCPVCQEKEQKSA